MTLAELLFSITLIMVLALLIAGGSAKLNERSKATRCCANLRALAMASIQYASENSLSLPASSHQRRSGIKSWTVSLGDYLQDRSVFRCPCDENEGRAHSYALNDMVTVNPPGAPSSNYSRLPAIPQPSHTILFAEMTPGYENSDHFHFSYFQAARRLPPAVFTAAVAHERHFGGACYAFTDGHAEWLTANEVDARLTNPDSGFVFP